MFQREPLSRDRSGHPTDRGSTISAEDAARIEDIAQTFQGRRLDDIVGFLNAARELLNADYAIWCVGQCNRATRQNAILEFYDSAAKPRNAAELETHQEWLRIAMELNIHSKAGLIFDELVRDESHVTFRQADWTNVGVRPALRLFFDTVVNLPLFIARRKRGLGDMIFNLCRHPTMTNSSFGSRLSYGSGVGYHRRVDHVQPLFSERDRAVAHELSRRNPWIHASGVKVDFDATQLKAEYRILIPFLLRTYSCEEIGQILGRSGKTISNSHIGKVAEAMGLHDRSRDAIREFYRPRVALGAMARSGDEEIEAGLRSLQS